MIFWLQLLENVELLKCMMMLVNYHLQTGERLASRTRMGGCGKPEFFYKIAMFTQLFLRLSIKNSLRLTLGETIGGLFKLYGSAVISSSSTYSNSFFPNTILFHITIAIVQGKISCFQCSIDSRGEENFLLI